MRTISKNLVVLLLMIGSSAFFISASSIKIDTKDLLGAWEYGSTGEKTVMINTENVFSVATYDLAGKKFLHSYGGTWRLQNNQLIRMIEWNSKDSLQVGKELIDDIKMTNGKLVISQSNQTWIRLDDGKPGALMGAWIITGNYVNDKVSKRANAFYPRRTMKILSGKYFHWIAYNVATKTFVNAGGGTYTTNDGKYNETIEFFTKTPESIGKSLTFDYSFVKGDWRHKGQKSTGGAMDECWSKRTSLEK